MIYKVTLFALMLQDAEQIKLELQDMEKELRTMEDQMSSLKAKISHHDKQLEQLNEVAESTKVASLCYKCRYCILSPLN